MSFSFSYLHSLLLRKIPVCCCVCRPLGDGGVFVLDADTNECLHYEAVPGLPLKKKTHIPRDIFEKHQNVEVRNDLIDCGIDICSVEVCVVLVVYMCFSLKRKLYTGSVIVSR